MKQTKTSAVHRTRKKPGTQLTKRDLRARKPLHKRVVLHPFSIMVLLCVGVLITGVTIRSFADSYTVTATVPAPLPKKAAIILKPLTQQHVSTGLVMVNGSCPAQSYVALSVGNMLGGVAQCTNQAFQIQTGLNAGANQITAQVYSLTDQAGPTGSPVTVYYDQTTTVPPTSTISTPSGTATSTPPTTMWVSAVDTGTVNDRNLTTSTNPTVSGWAPPWSMLTITFHSNPEVCITQADAIGWWTCTLDRTLPVGIHHVSVSAVTPGGKVFTSPTYQINVSPTAPDLLRKAPTTPLSIQTSYHYRVYVGSQSVTLGLGVAGGTSPYIVTTDWGDGTTTTVTPANPSSFVVDHAYSATAANKNYPVLVHVSDAVGQSSYVQLSAVVRGAGIVLASDNRGLSQYLTNIQHWLWLIWPTYVIVVLMAVGYYLGEREEYRHLVAKRRLRSHAKVK